MLATLPWSRESDVERVSSSVAFEASVKHTSGLLEAAARVGNIRGPQKLSTEGARIEATKALRGVRIGGVPSLTDYGVWESVVSSPAGSGAKPRPPTHF